MKTNNAFMLILFSVCLFSAFSAQANTSEIQHLINYVSNTQCTYVRNGDKHTGKEAVEHIQKKYDYFSDDIKTAEDFIRLSATKSTFSGKPYKVICEGKTMDSAQWLLDELKRFRQQVKKPTH